MFLRGEYLAISTSHMYAAMPTSHEICICLTSWGHLFVPNITFYLVDKIEWCMHALFIRNQDLVWEQCLVESLISHANLEFNLDGYIWVISILASERIQFHFLEETHLEPIVPPLTHIYIGNGCEGYSTNIYIPSKTYLTSEIDTSSRYDFFVSFNVTYQNIMQYGVWNELKLETLTLEQEDLLVVKLFGVLQWL